MFVKFPNGKVWLIDSPGGVTGHIVIPEFMDLDGLEAQLDAVAEAATGSVVGLSDISLNYLGDDIVQFSGSAYEIANFGEGLPDGYEEIAGDALAAALSGQYSLEEHEVKHALESLGDVYSPEMACRIVGTGREFRVPVSDQAGFYVRVVVDGYEIAYWDAEEFAGSPHNVLKAFATALRAQVQPE